jgi:hypothetical protein
MGIDPISAGIIGLTTLGSSLIGSGAASDASNAQVQATNAANATQEDIFNKQTALQEPFRQAGITGQNKLLDILGLSGNTGASDYGMYSPDKSFTSQDFLNNQDPGYGFRLSEGLKAVNNSMAAKGLGISGADIKGVNNYAQGAASQEYQNAFNRYQVNRTNAINPLQALAGEAQSSANTLGAQAGQMGQTISENQLQAGNARASGYIGSANALTNALSGGINSFVGLRNSGYGGGYGPGSVIGVNGGSFDPYAAGYDFGPQG